MRIALDFDGVLADTNGSWLREYNLEFGKDLKLSDLDVWDFFVKFDMSKNKMMDIFGRAWSTTEKLSPLEPDLTSKTKIISEYGLVDVVSHVPDRYYDDLKRWLAIHRVVYNDLILTKSKYELEYDVFIDDSPKNARELTSRNKLCLLYNQFWNESVRENLYTKRIYNLHHAIHMLKNG